MSIIKKTTYYLSICLILLLIFNVSKDIYRLMNAGQRLEDAEKKLAAIVEENEKLKKQQKDGKNDYYLEKEIRDKLGMAKPDETVIILPEELELTDKHLGEEEKQNLPNWEKWLNVFIKE